MKPVSRVLRFCICLLAVVGCPLAELPGHAQLGVYGGFEAAKFDFPNTGWVYGSSFGLYLDRSVIPNVSLGYDLRGELLETGGSAGNPRFEAGYLGPRLSVRPPVVHLKPYAEGLVGAGHVQVGQGFAATSATKLSYHLAGGLDLTVFPRVDWRVFEFDYGGLVDLNKGGRMKSIQSGIVIRLPGLP